MRFWVLELVGLKGVKIYILWKLILLEFKDVGVIFGGSYFRFIVNFLEWGRYILKVKGIGNVLRK